MSGSLNGATRLYPIVGDPVAQVKSPSGVSHALAERGMNALCVPAHVAPRALGCRTLDGGGMAVFQAVGAFRLFTGIEPDAERMLRHFRDMSAAAP